MDKGELLEFISIARKQKFRKLNLSNKEIKELPGEIEKLHNIQSIDLSYNNIESFPVQITRLPQIKSLLLYRNYINHIPADIGNLKNLGLLDMSYNRLTHLPPEFGKLISLKTLDLSYNKLETLPLDFINLTSLKKLYLEHNNFTFPPEKVIKRGLYATMHFLFGEMRKKEASKVMVQVYNLPQSIHSAFSEYLNYFNDLVSVLNNRNIDFDIKYIRHDLQENLEIANNVSNYLAEFLSKIRQGLLELQQKGVPADNQEDSNLLEKELRNYANDLNRTLKEKNKEIEELREKLNSFTEILDRSISRKNNGSGNV